MSNQIKYFNSFLAVIEFLLIIEEREKINLFKDNLKEAYTRENLYKNNSLKNPKGYYYNPIVWFATYNLIKKINPDLNLEKLFIILPKYLSNIFPNNDDIMKLAAIIESSNNNVTNKNRYLEIWKEAYDNVKDIEPEDPDFWNDPK